MKPVVIAAYAGDEHAAGAIRAIASGSTMRKPRSFQAAEDGFVGDIHYGDGAAVDVELRICEQPYQTHGADFVVVTAEHTGKGYFTSSPHKLHGLRFPSYYSANGSRVLALYGDRANESRMHNVIRQAANHLAAEATRMGMFRPDFLSFPKMSPDESGTDRKHFRTVSDWVHEGHPVSVVSACCLHADESRRGIVSGFAPEITSLLTRTAKAAFAALPVQDWYIYTFGEADFEWLGDLGIAKVLLPYMWTAPHDQVRRDMAKNFCLTEQLGEQLDNVLPFSVRVGHLSDDATGVDIPWLVESSHERARQMLPVLLKNPPKIFEQLNGPEDVFARVQQEAFLYLWDTVRWGQVPGQERPRVFTAGLEVHGGYWAAGELFRGPRGEFLPLSWFPQAVRQHWGPWVLGNKQLQGERRRLSATLSAMGY